MTSDDKPLGYEHLTRFLRSSSRPLTFAELLDYGTLGHDATSAISKRWLDEGHARFADGAYTWTGPSGLPGERRRRFSEGDHRATSDVGTEAPPSRSWDAQRAETVSALQNTHSYLFAVTANPGGFQSLPAIAAFTHGDPVAQTAALTVLVLRGLVVLEGTGWRAATLFDKTQKTPLWSDAALAMAKRMGYRDETFSVDGLVHRSRSNPKLTLDERLGLLELEERGLVTFRDDPAQDTIEWRPTIEACRVPALQDAPSPAPAPTPPKEEPTPKTWVTIRLVGGDDFLVQELDGFYEDHAQQFLQHTDDDVRFVSWTCEGSVVTFAVAQIVSLEWSPTDPAPEDDDETEDAS
jgi:hypothetical protein